MWAGQSTTRARACFAPNDSEYVSKAANRKAANRLFVVCVFVCLFVERRRRRRRKEGGGGWGWGETGKGGLQGGVGDKGVPKGDSFKGDRMGHQKVNEKDK